MNEKQIFDSMMDDNEKALYAIAEKLIKEGKNEVACLIFAVLVGYRFELVAKLLNIAIYPIIDAAEIALQDIFEEMSRKN